jgi:hypothetical protein
MNKICRPASTEDTIGTRGSRRVESYNGNVFVTDTGTVRGFVQTIANLRQTHVGPFRGPRRILAQSVDQEFFLAVNEGVIYRRPAEINTGHYLHILP